MTLFLRTPLAKIQHAALQSLKSRSTGHLVPGRMTDETIACGRRYLRDKVLVPDFKRLGKRNRKPQRACCWLGDLVVIMEASLSMASGHTNSSCAFDFAIWRHESKALCSEDTRRSGHASTQHSTGVHTINKLRWIGVSTERHQQCAHIRYALVGRVTCDKVPQIRPKA
jgi:hypothetical protein